MMPRAKVLFRLQRGLSFQGWKDPKEDLHHRLRGFWGLDIEVSHTPTTLLLTLPL